MNDDQILKRINHVATVIAKKCGVEITSDHSFTYAGDNWDLPWNIVDPSVREIIRGELFKEAQYYRRHNGSIKLTVWWDDCRGGLDVYEDSIVEAEMAIIELIVDEIDEEERRNRW